MEDHVPVPGVMLERLVALGVDVARILERAGLTRAVLAVPRGRLTTAEYFALWRAIEELGGSRDLGLRLGAEALPHKYDIASMAALHSPSVAEALAKIAKYKRLVCPEELSVVVRRGEARLRFHWLLAEGDPPRFLVDGTFASVLAMLRRGTQKPIAPLRLELARRRSDVPLLTRHFGCELRFDAAVDLLVLPAAVLAEPFVTHNADLLALLLPGLDAELDALAARRSLVDDVRLALRRHMCGERPSVDKVARELRVSPRTLQRRLGEAGTTYQHLLDEVRSQSARRLLAGTDLDAGQVAFLLGFEELNSFTRAFQGWEGTTPTRYRAQARPEGA
ncbi:AraC family transcriptional regulator [Nannocystis sp. SCPEA4]|uniref:AraC family transcriptional regulator n=1 Tax=Nannocystis sp. SCPEA4 TaxID=2996787 RepID=UPI0022717C5A|nr:AraC family transcriptional regulator [Nannocystis sp. SCPEA4]MCY1054993.1 AraC family transcriptional regulator [Nannocystis sp. SCPEA4]